VLALRRRLAKSEIVLAHGSTTLAVTSLATLGRRTPFVYRSVGDPSYWSSTLVRRSRVSAYLRRAAAVVVLWPGAADFLSRRLRVARSRIAVIPNGVPAARFAPPGEGARRRAREQAGIPVGVPLLVSVGSLTPEKDLATTLRALTHLPEAWLLVVGDGPLLRPLQSLAAELAPGRVVFAGTTDDPGSALWAADVAVLSSRTEGMPGALIEAGLCAVPAVACDVGGVREVVVDGQTGRLVPSGAPDRLAAAVSDVLGAGPQLGASARVRCLERFDIEVVADAWNELLRRLGLSD
jgi:glycosyltransferase involved in cell wall biosynthesis